MHVNEVCLDFVKNAWLSADFLETKCQELGYAISVAADAFCNNEFEIIEVLAHPLTIKQTVDDDDAIAMITNEIDRRDDRHCSCIYPENCHHRYFEQYE